MQSTASGSNGTSNASEDVRRLIRREQEIMDAARRLRLSARNKAVRSQCDSQISEAARNISYLQEQLNKLNLEPKSRGAQTGKQGNLTNGNESNSSSHNSKVTRLDLFRWDRPASMGPRIKLMLQQLEYKTSIEQQYECGTRKLISLYQQTGDRRSQAEAGMNLAESIAKMALLKRSKKRYSDMNLTAVLGNNEDDDDITGYSVPNVRKPLTGIVRVLVSQVEEVDHTISWADKVEMWVTMKVENNSAAVSRTRSTSTSVFNEYFTILVDKGNEIEFTVYDRSLQQNSGQQSANPVALLWLRISDIAEAIRQKRVERELKQMGWISAAQVQAQQAGGAGITHRDDFKFPNGVNGSSTALNHLPSGLDKTANARNGPIDNEKPKVSGSSDDDEIDTVEGWFTLEPTGRIYLKLGFEKTGANAHKRVKAIEQANLARLGRHNAIRKREETQQVHGHEFIPHQTYNIVRCAVCGDLTSTYFQCQECQLTCDRKCFSKIVTKCTALMSQDPDEELNHRIPHHFEPTTNMKAVWCAQCGFILPLASRKNVRKCTECSIIVHADCTQYVPNLCGMSMETAAQVVNEINSTRIRQATKAAAGSYGYKRQETRQHPIQNAQTMEPSHNRSHYHNAQHYTNNGNSVIRPEMLSSISETPNAYGQYKSQHTMLPPPPKTAPVRRKQVPGTVSTVQNNSDSVSSAVQQAPSKAPVNQTASSVPEKPVHLLPELITPPVKTDGYINQQVQSTLPSVLSIPDPLAQSAPPIPSPQKPSPNRFEQSAQPGPHDSIRASTQNVYPKQDAVQSANQGHLTYQQQPLQKVQPLSPPKRRRRKVGLDDFSFLAVLGKGNFGKVMLAESKHTEKLYAIKVLKKNFIIDNREVESTRSEKRVFMIANKARHPFLINLSACFQTENRIYFVMDYVSGGDLMFHIQQKMFSPKRAQFYAAEVLLAIKHFHDNDVIYRDLKLDNILLDINGHIKVADYGLCKENMGIGQTTGTFCGTPDFIAPEILLDQKYGRSVDWWAFGVLLYQMLLGKSPFHGNDEDEVYDAILSDEPLYPIHMPRDSVSILQQLLTRDPAKRLGSGSRGAEEIMNHPYFSNINFEDLYNLKIEPPFRPELDSPTDVRYFERDFTSELPALTPMNSTLTLAMQDEFRGFSYCSGDTI